LRILHDKQFVEGRVSAWLRGTSLACYWAVWFATLFLPRFLYRRYRTFEWWEIDAAYSKHRRSLRIHSWVVNGSGFLLLPGLLWILFGEPFEVRMATHVMGALYGGSLVIDAGVPWFTKIRSIPGPRPRRYVIIEERTWRAKLQLGIALAYCLVALVLLSGSLI